MLLQAAQASQPSLDRRGSPIAGTATPCCLILISVPAEVSCLAPYHPLLGAFLAPVHQLLLFLYGPATTTQPAQQWGWFPISWFPG